MKAKNKFQCLIAFLGYISIMVGLLSALGASLQTIHFINMLPSYIFIATGVSFLSLTEWFERRGDKEFKHFLFVAKGSCGEVRSMLYLALSLEYIDKERYEKYHNLSIETSRLLSGFIKTL